MKKRYLFSTLLTFIVIVMLFLAGPAGAVQLGFKNLSNPTPDEQTYVIFSTYVDIETSERIPVANLLLKIGSQTCLFNPDGSEISGSLCNDIVITSLNPSPQYDPGNLSGYDSNLGYGYDFGYGYGYSYDSLITHELDYTINWTTPDVSVDTSYDVVLEAYVVNDGNEHTYTNTEVDYITVKAVTPLKPDLNLKHFYIQYPRSSPIPQDSKTVIAFLVENSGEANATNVEWSIDFGDNLTVNGIIPQIEAGKATVMAQKYIYADAGNYTATAIVDPSDLIAELNEGNNQRTLGVNVV